MKKRQQQDPLSTISHPKRRDKKYTIASDALSDRIPNDWLALFALSGGAFMLYELSQMMGDGV